MMLRGIRSTGSPRTNVSFGITQRKSKLERYFLDIVDVFICSHETSAELPSLPIAKGIADGWSGLKKFGYGEAL
jgi:hypothetical protein